MHSTTLHCFFAFTFEAYLNHVGAEEITFWEEIDRISYIAKLKVIESHLKLKNDHGKAPFQFIRELFSLRNMLAHGRTIDIDLSYETDHESDDFAMWRIHEWEKLTIDKVSKYSGSVEKATGIINNARPKPEDDYMLFDMGICGATIHLNTDNLPKDS